MTAMTYGMADIKKCITEETKTNTDLSKDLEKRIGELERWKWLMMGGSIALGTFAHEIVARIIK